jgi:hypothetical protein
MSSVKKCEKTFCKKYTQVYTQAIIKALVKRTKKKTFSISKKEKAIIEKICSNTYCNPGCKGTIYQNNSFPKELEKKYSKKLINKLKKNRKELFKKKKSVLVNNFYKDLKNTTVKKLKKKGAISGCVSG